MAVYNERSLCLLLVVIVECIISLKLSELFFIAEASTTIYCESLFCFVFYYLLEHDRYHCRPPTTSKTLKS